MKRFKATLVGRGPNGAWAFLPIPSKVTSEFGTRARIAVTGTINGAVFRSSLMPTGDGGHEMMVNSAIRAAANACVGDLVAVEMEKDLAPRVVTIPVDLAEALNGHPKLAAALAAMAYSHQKEFVRWIDSAKRPETRMKRIADTLSLLAQGRHRDT